MNIIAYRICIRHGISYLQNGNGDNVIELGEVKCADWHIM